jgi:hypothetical protein
LVSGCGAGKAGRITAAGMTKEVTLEPVDGAIKRPPAFHVTLLL